MIEITNLTSNPIDEDFFKKIAENVLEGERKKGMISLVLVGPQRIKGLNRKYRNRNKATDVLSFSALNGKDFITPRETPGQLGEIFICLREVRKQAKRKNSSFEKELTRTFVHGILHLLGYEHYKESNAEAMSLLEDKYLKSFF